MLGDLMAACVPAIVFLALCAVLGCVIDHHYNKLEQQARGVQAIPLRVRLRARRRRRGRRPQYEAPQAGPYAPPRVIRVEFGDELDDYICRED